MKNKIKKCKYCGETKPLEMFYPHPKTKDGHVNKCKVCSKKHQRAWFLEKKKDPAFVLKERRRGRERYKRLDYKIKKKKSPDLILKYCDVYKQNYPEKNLAKMKSKRIVAPEGKQKHHWSYNEEHWKDVIFLAPAEHYKIHRHMVYDQEYMMYRTLGGELLDTKEKALNYYPKILKED